MSNLAKPATRRGLLKLAIMLGVGSQALLFSGNWRTALGTARASVGDVSSWPEMQYRTLGRTGFRASRLVFGAGAALSRGQAVDLLEPALDAGVNVFDVGTSRYYGDAEMHLGRFAKKHRDKIFLISKAYAGVNIKAGEEVSVEQAREGARIWTALMDESLEKLGMDHVDAYYCFSHNNVSLLKSDELQSAFLKAKAAGKVTHWGVSTHENAEKVLLDAAETGLIDLAQIAITPAGWYDWNAKAVQAGTPDMASLRPVLDTAREAGIGLIGMKAARHLAGRGVMDVLDFDKQKTFDGHYSEAFMKSGLNAFQRSYAYVLEHGLDCVNADSQTFQHLFENFTAAATAHTHFG